MTEELQPRYDITVLTLISQGRKPHARDEITFYDVGDSVKQFIAGSCKSTLFMLMKLPEDKSTDAWNLKYRTVVRQAGTDITVSDTKLITFPGMDDPSIRMFKLWAAEQLVETIHAVDNEREAGIAATKKRSLFLTMVRALWGRKNQ